MSIQLLLPLAFAISCPLCLLAMRVKKVSRSAAGIRRPETESLPPTQQINEHGTTYDLESESGTSCDAGALAACHSLTQSGRLSAHIIAQELGLGAAAVAHGLDKLSSLNPGRPLTCETLCDSLLQDAPGILGVPMPSKSSLACIDEDCLDEIDVSDEALGENPLMSPNARLESDLEPRTRTNRTRVRSFRSHVYIPAPALPQGHPDPYANWYRIQVEDYIYMFPPLQLFPGIAPPPPGEAYTAEIVLRLDEVGSPNVDVTVILVQVWHMRQDYISHGLFSRIGGQHWSNCHNRDAPVEDFDHEMALQARYALPDLSDLDSSAVVRSILNVFFSVYPGQAADATKGTAELGVELTRRSEMKKKMLVAAQRATAWISSALRKLGAAQAQNFVRKWFGKHRDQLRALRHVRAILRGAHEVLSNVILRRPGNKRDLTGSRKFCDDDTYAYVSPGLRQRIGQESRYVVYLCDLVLNSDSLSVILGTLVHEATHHYGTLDWAYDKDDCETLAKAQPLHAITNADSMEFFVADLVSNFWKGCPETWLEPLEDNLGVRWTPGANVRVREFAAEDWQEATVVGIEDGLVTARLPQMERGSWRFFNEVEKIEAKPLTLGTRVRVRDMKKDGWLRGIVIGVNYWDEKPSVHLLETDPKKRQPNQSWKYLELDD